MLKKVVVDRIVSIHPEGQSRPAIATGFESESGERVRLLVKLRAPAGSEFEAHYGQMLAAEIISALLFARLGIRTPRPYLVEIDSQFISTDNLPELAERLKGHPRLAFATNLLHSDGLIDTRNLKRSFVNRFMDQIWWILVGDNVIYNIDRRKENPNLLADRTGVYAIDHGLAFVLWLQPGGEQNPDGLKTLPIQHFRSIYPRQLLSFGRSPSTELPDPLFQIARVLNPGYLDQITDFLYEIGLEGGLIQGMLRRLRFVHEYVNEFSREVVLYSLDTK